MPPSNKQRKVDWSGTVSTSVDVSDELVSVGIVARRSSRLLGVYARRKMPPKLIPPGAIAHAVMRIHAQNKATGDEESLHGKCWHSTFALDDTLCILWNPGVTDQNFGTEELASECALGHTFAFEMLIRVWKRF